MEKWKSGKVKHVDSLRTVCKFAVEQHAVAAENIYTCSKSPFIYTPIIPVLNTPITHFVSPFNSSTLPLLGARNAPLQPLTFPHLSTPVHKIMWIAVNKWWINALQDSGVDKRGFDCKVIHRLCTGLANAKMCCGQGIKKILDQLSPYPQSLLLTLNYKIFL